VRILIVEDHELMLEGIRHALALDGCFQLVGEARTGSEILPLVDRTNPHVVMLDNCIDGLGYLKRIRARHPNVKVVIWSRSTDFDHIQAAFQRGACGYILTSISASDLGPAIRQAVDGTAYHALGLPAINEKAAARAAGLSDREADILKGVAGGRSNKAIAADLSITAPTVKFHLTSIYRKLAISNRTEAALWAISKGLDVERKATL
jgi:DNA-binding NarL/FixJ family response regulator